MSVAGLVALAAVTSGCATTSGASPQQTATATVERPAAETTDEPVSGVGATGWPGVDFALPADARSVSMDFTCDGSGPYTVELGDSMAANLAMISGSCDAKKPLEWPIDAETVPMLVVTVEDGIAWKAVPHFSSEEFTRDAAVTAECAAFSDIYSALMNADQGYGRYQAFDAAEWSRRVETASSQLDDLAAASTSALRAPLTAMSEAVAALSEPGTALVGTEEPAAQVRAACDANQTPFFLTAEFGG